MKTPFYIGFIFFLLFLSCKKQVKPLERVFQPEKDSILFINDSKVIYPRTSIPFSDKMYAESRITFEVEKLERASTLLNEDSLSFIFENTIRKEYSKGDLSLTDSMEIDYNIRAHYNGAPTLVNYGNRSFFWGMRRAYADHRPFVLSPDIVWLLISQGFAYHVNNNQEELRSHFVNFDNKATLTVLYDSVEDLIWEDMFAEFPKQISHFTGDELIDVLSCNFSTSSPINKTVSEITIMSALEPYFEFYGGGFVCGIPEITLEGTPQDWESVLTKAQYLKKYKLEWWIKELEPVLKEFIKTSKGNINKKFWKDMFKLHSAEMCGDPDYVDGWIVKFFPYLSDGKRTNLKKITLDDDLAPEIVKVDLNYIFSDGVNEMVIPLEIWAGIWGLRQDTKTFALKPDLGWMIRKKNVKNPVIERCFSENNPYKTFAFKTTFVPKELLNLKEADWIIIEFTGQIIIPDEMANIKIKELSLYGEISEQEIERICKMFPNTTLSINSAEYNVK